MIQKFSNPSCILSTTHFYILYFTFYILHFSVAYAQVNAIAMIAPSPQQFGGFGRSLAAIGDVNNDGMADLLVGMPTEDVGGVVDVGRIYLMSGADNNEIYSLDSPTPQMSGTFGMTLATTDITGDGISDLLVGTQEDAGGFSFAGTVHAFNGQNGSLLYTLASPNPQDFGWFSRSITAIGDITNDGIPEIVVGSVESPGNISSAGSAYVFDGSNGNFIQAISTPDPTVDGEFALDMAVLPDLNGDGIPDLLIGSCESPNSLDQAGRAYLLSGSDFSQIYTLESAQPSANGYFSWTVADAGDVNNDGIHDLMIGSREPVGGFTAVGRCYIFDGTNGNFLFSLEPPNPDHVDWFSRAISTAGDINRDGFDDLLVGAPFDDSAGFIDAGQVYLFSGNGGALLDSIVPPGPEFNGLFGFSLSGNWNSNQSTNLDIVVSAYRSDVDTVLDAGRVYRFRSQEVAIDPLPLLNPGTIQLKQNYPNPFNPKTDIRYQISDIKFINLVVFDALGKKVRTLVNKQLSPGSYTVTWDGHDDSGNPVPSGVYFYRLASGEQQLTRRMLLLR